MSESEEAVVTNSDQKTEKLSTVEKYSGVRDAKLFRKRTERTRRGQLSIWEYRLGDIDVPDGTYKGSDGRIRLSEKDGRKEPLSIEALYVKINERQKDRERANRYTHESTPSWFGNSKRFTEPDTLGLGDF